VTRPGRRPQTNKINGQTFNSHQMDNVSQLIDKKIVSLFIEKNVETVSDFFCITKDSALLNLVHCDWGNLDVCDLETSIVQTDGLLYALQCGHYSSIQNWKNNLNTFSLKQNCIKCRRKVPPKLLEIVFGDKIDVSQMLVSQYCDYRGWWCCPNWDCDVVAEQNTHGGFSCFKCASSCCFECGSKYNHFPLTCSENAKWTCVCSVEDSNDILSRESCEKCPQCECICIKSLDLMRCQGCDSVYCFTCSKSMMNHEAGCLEQKYQLTNNKFIYCRRYNELLEKQSTRTQGDELLMIMEQAMMYCNAKQYFNPNYSFNLLHHSYYEYSDSKDNGDVIFDFRLEMYQRVFQTFISNKT